MKYRLDVLPEAIDDLAAIVERLRFESPVTVVKLQQELLAVERQLEQFPFAYQAASCGPFRRAHLHSTHHTLYFRVAGRVVTVVAVLSSRFGPQRTRERLATASLQ